MKPYYEDSAVTLYHGDCREVVPGLGERFDLLLTDPPYGLAMRMKGGGWGMVAAMVRGGWDLEAPDVGFCVEAAERSIVWGGNYFGLPASRCWLSWHKPDAVPSMANVEYAWTNLDRNSRQISRSISSMNAERVGHPTQKPLAVMAWCLELAGPAVKTVLDPYAGSGTTGRAAKDRGLRAVLIEREEEHCERAARRMEQEVFQFQP